MIHRKMTIKTKSTWRCHHCRNPSFAKQIPKHDTPEATIEQLLDATSPNPDAETSRDTRQTGFTHDSSSIQSIIEPLLEEIRSLRRDFNEMRNEARECSCRDAVEETKHELTLLKEKVQRFDVMEKEIKMLKIALQDLKTENNTRDQWSRMNNIEIVGIPERDGENLTAITCKIAASLGITMQPSDVQFAHRVTPRSQNAPKPKIVIAKLSRMDIKDNIIAAVRLKRGITTKDIGFQGEERRIFINYHLSRENKQLLQKAKEFAKSKAFKFVWVSRSRIFIRRAENSPVHCLSTIADFEKIL